MDRIVRPVTHGNGVRFCMMIEGITTNGFYEIMRGDALHCDW